MIRRSAVIAGTWLVLVASPGSFAQATDVHVIDGDTLVTPDGAHWRLAGINAPEVPHPRYGKPDGEPGGEEAKGFLADEVAGHGVTCTQEGVVGSRTSYDRDIGYCAVDGRDLGLVMVREGHACRWTRFDRNGRYEAAEQEARRAKAGIWAGTYRPKGCRP